MMCTRCLSLASLFTKHHCAPPSAALKAPALQSGGEMSAFGPDSFMSQPQTPLLAGFRRSGSAHLPGDGACGAGAGITDSGTDGVAFGPYGAQQGAPVQPSMYPQYPYAGLHSQHAAEYAHQAATADYLGPAMMHGAATPRAMPTYEHQQGMLLAGMQPPAGYDAPVYQHGSSFASQAQPDADFTFASAVAPATAAASPPPQRAASAELSPATAAASADGGTLHGTGTSPIATSTVATSGHGASSALAGARELLDELATTATGATDRAGRSPLAHGRSMMSTRSAASTGLGGQQAWQS